MYVTCVPVVHGSQKRASGPLNWDNSHVDGGSQT